MRRDAGVVSLSVACFILTSRILAELSPSREGWDVPGRGVTKLMIGLLVKCECVCVCCMVNGVVYFPHHSESQLSSPCFKQIL